VAILERSLSGSLQLNNQLYALCIGFFVVVVVVDFETYHLPCVFDLVGDGGYPGVHCGCECRSL